MRQDPEPAGSAPAALGASAVMSAGSARAGAVVSCTVTVNDPDELLPAASVAVQVTVVVPSGNVLPDAGEQTTTGDGSLSSVAVTV